MSQEMTLITNLNFVSMQKPFFMRFEAHALLFRPAEEDKGLFGRKGPELVAFAEEASSPIFSLPVETLDHQITDTHDPTKMIMQHEGGMRPLFQGAVLTIDKYEFFLQVEDYNKALSIDKFQRPVRSDFKDEQAYYGASSDFHDKLWAKLQERTAQFWHAPFYPIKNYLPVEIVRLSLAKAGLMQRMSRHDLARAMSAIEVIRRKGEATLTEIDEALRGLQSTDEPALTGFYEELEAMRKKRVAKNKTPGKEH